MSVEHPDYYKAAAAQVEPIVLCSKFGFCFGNFIKYVLRAGRKGPELSDLKKARYYFRAAIDDRAGWEQCADTLRRERALVEAYGNPWLNQFYATVEMDRLGFLLKGYEYPLRLLDSFSRHVDDLERKEKHQCDIAQE